MIEKKTPRIKSFSAWKLKKKKKTPYVSTYAPLNRIITVDVKRVGTGNCSNALSSRSFLGTVDKSYNIIAKNTAAAQEGRQGRWICKPNATHCCATFALACRTTAARVSLITARETHHVLYACIQTSQTNSRDACWAFFMEIRSTSAYAPIPNRA